MTGTQEPTAADPGTGPKAEAARTALRERLVGALSDWVDTVLAGEAPPAGVDAELLARVSGGGAGASDAGGTEENPREPDLYGLWQALVTLAQEVKLQGRAFQRLGEALEPLSGALGPLEAATARMEVVATATAVGEPDETVSPAELRRARETARAEGEARGLAGSLDVLLDLRDRLVRGQEAARTARGGPRTEPGWLARLLRGPRSPDAELQARVDALEQGYALTLARLDEELSSRGVRPMACLGRPVDPRRMRVVDLEVTGATDEGTVTAVYRAGYERQGEVVRPAEVRVAQAPTEQGPVGEQVSEPRRGT